MQVEGKIIGYMVTSFVLWIKLKVWHAYIKPLFLFQLFPCCQGQIFFFLCRLDQAQSDWLKRACNVIVITFGWSFMCHINIRNLFLGHQIRVIVLPKRPPTPTLKSFAIFGSDSSACSIIHQLIDSYQPSVPVCMIFIPLHSHAVCYEIPII